MVYLQHKMSYYPHLSAREEKQIREIVSQQASRKAPLFALRAMRDKTPCHGSHRGHRVGSELANTMGFLDEPSMGLFHLR